MPNIIIKINLIAWNLRFIFQHLPTLLRQTFGSTLPNTFIRFTRIKMTFLTCSKYHTQYLYLVFIRNYYFSQLIFSVFFAYIEISFGHSLRLIIYILNNCKLCAFVWQYLHCCILLPIINSSLGVGQGRGWDRRWDSKWGGRSAAAFLCLPVWHWARAKRPRRAARSSQKKTLECIPRAILY